MIEFLPSIMQGITGIGQFLSGIFGKPERPHYTKPAAAEDALRQSKRLAGQTKLPGQEQELIGLGENTANMTGTIEKIGAGGAGLGALSSIYSQEAKARRQLLGDASRYYASNQNQLNNALSRYATYQDKEWQKNIGDKYDEQAAASSALVQSGLSNTNSALGNVSGTVAYQNLMKDGNSTNTNSNINSYESGWMPFKNGFGNNWNQNPYYSQQFQSGYRY